MNRLFRQKTFCGFAAILFGTLSYGKAQITVAMSQDQGPTTATVIASPLGPTQVGIVSTRAGFALQESVEAVKNEPYQAQANTEMKQTLTDGSHIDQTTTATVARDSEGRTVRIQKLSKIGPWKSSSATSQESGPTLASIFDPVAGTHIDYTSDTKVAHVIPMPQPPPAGAFTAITSGIEGAPGNPGTNVMYSMQGRAVSPNADKEEDTKAESLGTKTIEGIQVTGTRNTDTIPAGTIGNDKDIVITRETWYSPDLKLVIQSTQNDPRFGQTTYSLMNIQRGEPDESLFQVPEGYKVDKVPVRLQTHVER
jgi:hypothetical protein